MKDFLKFTFASVLGVLISLIVVVLVFFGIVASAVSFAENEVVVVPEKSVLHVQLDHKINDRGVVLPPNMMSTSFELKKRMGLVEIVDNLRKAAVDENIEGILLDLTSIPAGMATLTELRDELLAFKKSGKFIYAYSETYTQGTYFVASVADKVFLHPEGGMFFKGLSSEVMFYKGLLEKLDIDAQIIRHGTFKSAVEPYMLDKMSKANREQIQLLLDQLWQQLVGDISISRKISVKELNRIADELAVRNPDKALELKLVDELCYRDQLNAALKEKLGLMEDEKLNLVKFSKYDDAVVADYRKKFSKNKLAVIYAIGPIGGGEGSDLEIGSEKIARTIRKARLDSTVKAIVFRVNSPGGSALASDVIWREVTLAKKEKPFVVSFGDVAASGGYYISAPGDKIFASPTTITGSIGVFGIIPNFQGLMNKVGVTVDNVGTNKNSEFISATRPMTDFQRQVMQESIEDIYKTFTGIVAKGRNMPIEEVNKIGEGRVWPGTVAKDIKLVDEFGGLYDAIDAAAEMAELDSYRLLSWPKQKDPIQQLLEEITGEKQASILESELGQLYPYYETLKTVSQMEGVQARMPYHITIY